MFGPGQDFASCSRREQGHRSEAPSARPGAWRVAQAHASSRAVWPRLLVEPPRALDLTLQREGLLERGLDLRPRLRAPALVQHRTQDAVDAEPGVPEARVGVVHFRFAISSRM